MSGGLRETLIHRVSVSAVLIVILIVVETWLAEPPPGLQPCTKSGKVEPVAMFDDAGRWPVYLSSLIQGTLPWYQLGNALLHWQLDPTMNT